MCTKANIKFANSAALQAGRREVTLRSHRRADRAVPRVRATERRTAGGCAAPASGSERTARFCRFRSPRSPTRATDRRSTSCATSLTIKNREAALAHRAEHDWLTGLVNRARFESRLHEMLVPGAGPGAPRRFASGRGAVHRSRRLQTGQRSLRPRRRRRGARRGRRSSPRFNARQRSGRATWRRRVRGAARGARPRRCHASRRPHPVASFERPIVHEGQDLKVGASIGVADTHVGGDAEPLTAAELLHAADTAMYAVKQKTKRRRRRKSRHPERRFRPPKRQIFASVQLAPGVKLRAMATQTRAERKSDRRPDSRPARRRVQDDAPVAPPRRQGDPAQAPEQDLLPDLRRGARGDPDRRRVRAPAGVRLVLPLLSRPRALPAARHDGRGDAAVGGRRGERSELRRPADAEPLGPQEDSTSSRRRRRRERSSSRPSAPPRRRSARSSSASPKASRRTRSCSSRPATARRAKASSGSR